MAQQLPIQDPSAVSELPPEEKEELDRAAREGQTVVAGGTGGKSVDAQKRLAEGRHKGGEARREQMGTEGYQQMGKKGGLTTMEKSGQQRMEEEGIPIDESKYKTKSS